MLSTIASALVERGHEVARIDVPVPVAVERIYDLDVPRAVFENSHEFFRYVAAREAFSEVDASDMDVLISSQPPSFAIEHRRHLSIFYHHQRLFYDLSELAVEAGLVHPDIHLVAQAAVRRLDQSCLDAVGMFLAPDVVIDRLAQFNGIRDRANPFRAGSSLAERLLQIDARELTFEMPLLVGRHEFPKRSELFVHAMKFLPHTEGILVGSGGRLEWVKALDRLLSQPGCDLEAFTASDLWLNKGIVDAPLPTVPNSNCRFLSGLSEDALVDLFRQALCVVATPYQEDYGLTAVEAMAAGKPMIVCEDGGGLAHLVLDGITGLIVEPTGPAIASAIDRFIRDPELARWMGVNARQLAERYSWDNGLRMFFDAFDIISS